ncbi:MAG: HD domain-containing phosphohydrolase [Gammaproteobacteria bacterium]
MSSDEQTPAQKPAGGDNRLNELINLSRILGSADPFPRRFKEMVAALSDITDADGGSLYIYDNKEQKLKATVFFNKILAVERVVDDFDPLRISGLVEVPLRDASGKLASDTPTVACFSGREMIIVKDVATNYRFDFRNTQKFDEQHNYRTKSMIMLPLPAHDGRIVGVLQVINPARASYDVANRGFLSALAAQAGIALNNALLVTESQNLLNALVNMIVVAIDKKSSHTAGHCIRVTELTMMFADALARQSYDGFSLSIDERRELYLAALLHDVGKIITPTHVLEKSTKLQYLNDRINLLHERLRAWQQGQAYQVLAKKLRENGQQKMLDEAMAVVDADDDIAFLRNVNTNDIITDDTAIKRLEDIARRRFDENSGEEDTLIDSFDLENLKVRRGTLNDEERRIIEEHVSLSIRLLSSIPWPKNMQRIVEYAGSHHENINGTGYPNKITGDAMSIPAKILGIADRFEGLSAPDRPYRKTKMKLSGALRILKLMRDDGEIDPELTDFFLGEKIYLAYAKKHLPPELIDCD